MTSPTSEPTYNVPPKHMTRLKAAWTRYRSAQKELDEAMTELEVATSWVLLDDEARAFVKRKAPNDTNRPTRAEER